MLIGFVDGAIYGTINNLYRGAAVWLIAARTSKELHNVNMNRKPCASIVNSEFCVCNKTMISDGCPRQGKFPTPAGPLPRQRPPPIPIGPPDDMCRCKSRTQEVPPP